MPDKCTNAWVLMLYCSSLETFLCVYDHIFLQNDVLAFSCNMLKIKKKHNAYIFVSCFIY